MPIPLPLSSWIVSEYAQLLLVYMSANIIIISGFTLDLLEQQALRVAVNMVWWWLVGGSREFVKWKNFLFRRDGAAAVAATALNQQPAVR